MSTFSSSSRMQVAGAWSAFANSLYNIAHDSFGEETAVQAVVDSIIWAFRRLKKPKSREISARNKADFQIIPRWKDETK